MVVVVVGGWKGLMVMVWSLVRSVLVVVSLAVSIGGCILIVLWGGDGWL